MPTAKKTTAKVTKTEVKAPVVKKAAVKAAPVKTSELKKLSGLSAQVFSAAGVEGTAIELPKEIFGGKINKELIAQAVRVYLANQRLGTAKVKSRGEVDLTTAKWYKQKGTGRARHGAKSAPIFVKGGVAHGPKPKDYSLSLPKKMKKAALIAALSSKMHDGEIKVLTGMDKIEPKTKNVAALLKKLGLYEKKVLLVTPDGIKKGFENVYKAGRNVEGLSLVSAKSLSTYEALDNRMILFMREAIDVLKGQPKE